jgi:hypothetical protein
MVSARLRSMSRKSCGVRALKVEKARWISGF